MTAGRHDINWKRTKGDVDDIVVVQVGGVANLDGVTSVIGKVRAEDGSGTTVDLAAAVTDTVNRLVTVQLGTWLQTSGGSNAVAGTTYDLKLRISFGAAVWTWPEVGHATITVAAAP